MYITNIKFTPKEINEDILDWIQYLLFSLHHQGRSIFLRNRQYQLDQIIFIQINTPELNSLSEISNLRWFKKLKENDVNIEIEYLGKEVDIEGHCSCKQPGYFIFSGTPYIPLWCGTCDSSVPLYRIPPTHEFEKNYRDINSWNKENLAWSEIEFYSGEELFAHQQLGDLTSTHNIEAMELRSKIQHVSNTKCYYYLEELRYVKSTSEAKSRKCPSCNGNWLLKKQLHNKYDFKCDKCQILSSLAFVDE